MEVRVGVPVDARRLQSPHLAEATSFCVRAGKCHVRLCGGKDEVWLALVRYFTAFLNRVRPNPSYPISV